jgi:hypothetical protein
MTLKHDNLCHLASLVSPVDVLVSSNCFEIRYATNSTWNLLSTGVTNDWTVRVAGNFKLRAKVKVGNQWFFSSEKDVTIKFPSYSEIVQNNYVKAEMDQEWIRTLNDATVNGWREHGFWVYLDTGDNEYVTGEVAYGDYVISTNKASINIGERYDIPETFSANTTGVVYAVASFHTHTPTTYITGFPAGSVRLIGSSPADNNSDTICKTPGIIYDYVESPSGSGSIPLGYPRSAASKVYPSNVPDRRILQ